MKEIASSILTCNTYISIHYITYFFFHFISINELINSNTELLSFAIPGLDRRKRLSDARVIITQHFTERTVTPGGDVSFDGHGRDHLL